MPRLSDKDSLAILRALKPQVPDIYACRVDGFKPDGATGVPDKVWFLPSIQPMADLHDFRYWTGGKEYDRMTADWEFHDMIKRLGARLVYESGLLALPFNLWRRRELRNIADLYYLGVRLLGGGRDHFNYS